MEEAESVQEIEEGEENLIIPTQPKFEPCPEDDDFLAALDKMVNENIAESKTVGKILRFEYEARYLSPLPY